MAIRLEPELKSRLEKLATAAHRIMSFLASEAVREFAELNEWHIQEIEAVVKESDEGDFASPEEEAAVLNKWGIDAG